MEDTPKKTARPAPVDFEERLRERLTDTRPPDFFKKRRIWVCVQASGPDGLMAHEGDMSVELYLDHERLLKYQEWLQDATVAIQTEQAIWDRGVRKTSRDMKRIAARIAARKAKEAAQR